MNEQTKTAEGGGFHDIALVFEGNIRAIRTLNEDIGQVAEERDKTAILGFAQDLGEVLGLDPEVLSRAKVEMSRVKHDRMSRQDLTRPDENPKGQLPPDHKIGKEMSIILDDPKRRARFFEIIKGFERKSTTQALLVRRGAVVILVSYLEVLFSDLIRTYYKFYPAALTCPRFCTNGSERVYITA